MLTEVTPLEKGRGYFVISPTTHEKPTQYAVNVGRMRKEKKRGKPKWKAGEFTQTVVVYSPMQL